MLEDLQVFCNKVSRKHWQLKNRLTKQNNSPYQFASNLNRQTQIRYKKNSTRCSNFGKKKSEAHTMSNRIAGFGEDLSKLEFTGTLDWLVKIESLENLKYHKTFAITQLTFIAGIVIILIHGKISIKNKF